MPVNCIKCESNHFKNGVCMDCMAKDHEIEKQVRAAMAKPEWECCNGEENCTEELSCCECLGGHDFDQDEGGYCMNEGCEENGYEYGE